MQKREAGAAARAPRAQLLPKHRRRWYDASIDRSIDRIDGRTRIREFSFTILRRAKLCRAYRRIDGVDSLSSEMMAADESAPTSRHVLRKISLNFEHG